MITKEKMELIEQMPSFSDKLYGYVYVINNGTYIKIGMTSNLRQRINSLMKSNSGGHNLEDIFFSPISAIYMTLEKIMHNQLEEYKTVGEWYNYDYVKACNLLVDICTSTDYCRCNEIRKEFIENQTKHNQNPKLEALSRRLTKTTTENVEKISSAFIEKQEKKSLKLESVVC